MRVAVAGGTGVVGQHVVRVLNELGHTPVVLARSAGVDLVTGAGLAAALTGAGAVIDVATIRTRSAEKSESFFRAVTTHLLREGLAAGVSHYVALSIVGIDRVPLGYYAEKVLQEALIAQGALPWTVLRASQFHEFSAQIYEELKVGPVVVIPRMKTQPVAAREVGVRLVELALAPAAARVVDLAGPQEEELVAMVRSYARVVRAPGTVLGVPLPGALGRAMRNGTLLPGVGTMLGEQTFAEWLQLTKGPPPPI
ncbi:MAG: NAD(P)H-binding protein [Pseudomonadota bacterium]